MQLVATFFNHHGAVHFARALKDRGLDARPMPVPRRLSSSCGTCVRFEAPDFTPYLDDEVEQIFQVTENGHSLLYSSHAEE